MLDFSARNVYNIIVAEKQRGSLAQLGERLPYKQDVTGSSPVTPTNTIQRQYGPVVQLVRTLACHARGRGFEPHPDRQLSFMNESKMPL